MKKNDKLKVYQTVEMDNPDFQLRVYANKVHNPRTVWGKKFLGLGIFVEFSSMTLDGEVVPAVIYLDTDGKYNFAAVFDVELLYSDDSMDDRVELLNTTVSRIDRTGEWIDDDITNQQS